MSMLILLQLVLVLTGTDRTVSFKMLIVEFFSAISWIYVDSSTGWPYNRGLGSKLLSCANIILHIFTHSRSHNQFFHFLRATSQGSIYPTLTPWNFIWKTENQTELVLT
jgi:hypothetical protein